jgi:hypothetical protein
MMVGATMTGSIWLVILLFGKVGNVIGPLPGDMKHCEMRLAELSDSFDQRFEADAFAGAKPPTRDGREIKRANFTFECRSGENAPPKEIELR